MQHDRGDDTPIPVVLRGNQLVRKFNSTTPDEIHVLLAVFRIVSKNIDLVLSMNVPRTVEDGVADAKYQEAQRDFEIAVKSLHVLDFGLFV